MSLRAAALCFLRARPHVQVRDDRFDPQIDDELRFVEAARDPCEGSASVICRPAFPAEEQMVRSSSDAPSRVKKSGPQ